MKTDKMTRIAFALTLALAACGGATQHGGGTGGVEDETGGAGGGASETGGAGGTPVTTKKDAAPEPGTGGSPGTGGVMTASLDAAAGAGGEGGSGNKADAGPGGSGGGGVSAGHTGALGWYEAEAVPPNTLFGGSKIGTCGAGACASTAAIKEGMECCSAGKKLSQLLRGKGGAVFNAVMAPSDGMYDVTWWFHCGKNDNFGDANCGGAPHTPSGCRPHVFTINGTPFPKVYHFPCFPGSWGEIHASTVTMPLKAGMNAISVKATAGRDAADLDAIEVFPAGKGFPPNIVGTNN